MTIRKKIYSTGAIVFFVFVVLATMNIYSHQEVSANLRLRDEVDDKLASIREFVRWKNLLIRTISDIVASGHVPASVRQQLNRPSVDRTVEYEALAASARRLVDLLEEKARASTGIDNAFGEIRMRINRLYYELDEKIATILANAQLDQVLGRDTTETSALAPYVLKSLNQLTLVAMNGLISRHFPEEAKDVVAKNQRFISSQLQLIDPDGSTATLFTELFAQIEALDRLILESSAALSRLEQRITHSKVDFNLAIKMTDIDPLAGALQSDLNRANEALETASRRNLITVVIFLFVVPLLVIALGLFGLNTIILDPIAKLMNAMKHIEDGRFDVAAPISAPDEIGRLARAFNVMAAEIKESQERLDLALSGANEGIWDWHIDQDRIYFDSRYYSMAGYQPNEFPCAFEEWEKRVHEDDVEAAKSTIARYLAGDLETFDTAFRFLRKDGDYMWIQGKGKIVARDEQGNPVRFIGTHADITTQKRDQEELARLRSYLSNIIDSMPSIIVAVDGEGRVTQWNSQTENATGLSFESVRSRPLSEVFPRLTEEMGRIHASIRDCRVISVPKVPRQVGQEVRYEDLTIFPLVTNGVEGAAIRLDDVTERVRLEEMMIQSEKMLSVGGLAAGMAHEINNPLAGILQNVAVLENRLLGDLPANHKAAESAGTTLAVLKHYLRLRKLPDMIGNIRESGNRAADIVKNMLSFARKSDRRVSSHDLGVLLDQTLELVRTDYDMKKRYDVKQIHIERSYDAIAPTVPCEASKIQQVFMNILKNGAEAMAEAVDPPESPAFFLRVQDDGAWVRVEIEDNGPGLDEAVQRRIFEPFFTTKPAGRGTGLGLSVSYFIITEDHAGEMGVRQADGGGTCFVIRLPKAGRGG